MCPHWKDLAVKVKGWGLIIYCSICSVVPGFSTVFLQKSSLVRCSCAFRLHILAQDGLERRFAWQVQDMGQSYICLAGVALWARFCNAGRHVSNERYFLEAKLFLATKWKGRKSFKYYRHQLRFDIWCWFRVAVAELRMPWDLCTVARAVLCI